MIDRQDSAIPRSALLLGVTGALPFWFAVVAIWVEIPLPSSLDPRAIITGYGAVILSFLGGIRWGYVLGPCDRRIRDQTFILSVIPSLAGFVALIVPWVVGICLLLTGFLTQALWDTISGQNNRLPQWFVLLRMILTTLVCTALLAALAHIVFF